MFRVSARPLIDNRKCASGGIGWGRGQFLKETMLWQFGNQAGAAAPQVVFHQRAPRYLFQKVVSQLSARPLCCQNETLRLRALSLLARKYRFVHARDNFLPESVVLSARPLKGPRADVPGPTPGRKGGGWGGEAAPAPGPKGLVLGPPCGNVFLYIKTHTFHIKACGIHLKRLK